MNRLVEATGISATRLLELGSGNKPSDIEISNLAQGLWKDETHNWDEDELLELVVAQFGDRFPHTRRLDGNRGSHLAA